MTKILGSLPPASGRPTPHLTRETAICGPDWPAGKEATVPGLPSTTAASKVFR
jgi:hypothetical protein